MRKQHSQPNQRKHNIYLIQNDIVLMNLLNIIYIKEMRMR
jgi:hypothetical protein